MSTNRKPSIVTVKVPDLSGVLKEVYKDSAKFYSTVDKGGQAQLRGIVGYVETPVGIYVLDNEGCGQADPAMNDDAKVSFDFYIDTDSTMGVFPEGSFNLTARQLKNLPVKEEILLHDFVRSFGSRLEVNYEECKREFEACMI